MTETKLTKLLERAAAQTPVGPPPLDALHAGAARRHRRRTAGLTALTVVAVAAVIGGSTVLTSNRPTPPVTSATPAPPALRVVGFGHAAIAVPKDWPTNRSSCGTPQQDTILVDDPSAAHLCMSFRPSGVESVALYYGSPRRDFHADEMFQIDGVRAERQRTTCFATHGLKGTVTICGSTVVIPSLNVWFRAESSTDAAEVDRMLDRIQIVPDQSGVPSPWMIPGRPQGSVLGPPEGPLVADYTPLLSHAGLKAQYKRVKSPGYRPGTILGVSPAAGTMLPLGSTVTVTVTR